MPRKKSSTWSANWQMILKTFVREAEQVARTQQRQRVLSVENLVQSLVLGSLKTSKASLGDLCQVARDLGVNITKSSMNDRLTARVVMLLADIVERCMRQKLARPALTLTKLHIFTSVMIIDSSQITLPSCLYPAFRGNGTNAKMKVQVGYDYLQGNVQLLDCQAGRTSDQKSQIIEALMVEKGLLLFDMGYFEQTRLANITQAGAYFVTRCRSQVGLYDPETGQKIELVDILKRTRLPVFEGTFLLGRKTRTPVRVMARKVDAATAASRKRHARRRADKQKQTCTARHLKWLEWEILVTNLPDEWSVEDLFILYGIRWQIEIVFRVWKSELGIADYGEWRAERVMCQFYARLIGAILCHQTFGWIRACTHPLLSLAKTVKLIRHHLPALLTVIRKQWRTLPQWTQRVSQALLTHGLHDKRKTTPTTVQHLIDWGLT